MQRSYNGWPASARPADFGGLTRLVVAGESFSPGVRSGDVHTVLDYVARQLHTRVEPVVRPDWHQADDWGYYFRSVHGDNTPISRTATNLSTHASGTSIDFNATRHPIGRRGTFTRDQVAEIHRILAETDNAVTWGGVWSRPDEMHFEIRVSPVALRPVAEKIRRGDQTSPGAPRLLRLTSPRTRGDDVKLIQERLRDVYPSYARVLGPLVADSIFGPQTDKWVREFQSRSLILVDGVVGPSTRRLLGV